MQFHGSATLHSLTGASSLATLYSSSTTATSYPAVTLRNVGLIGGQAAAFTYDLAASIVYTRQGNPAWVGPGARRLRADPVERPVLRQFGERSAAQLDRPRQGARAAGRRATAVPREPDHADDAGPQAVAAVLVPAEGAPRRRHADGRRARHRGLDDAVRPAAGPEPGRLLGRRLGMPARHRLHVSEHAGFERAGGSRYDSAGFEVALHSDDLLRQLRRVVDRRRVRDAAGGVRGACSRALLHPRPIATTASPGAAGRPAPRPA